MFDKLTAFELGALRAILGNVVSNSRRAENKWIREHGSIHPSTRNDDYLRIRYETSEVLRDINRSVVRNRVIAH